MPESVFIDVLPVEKEEMAPEDHSSPNTCEMCTAPQVTEPAADQVQMEIETLKQRVLKAEAEAEKAKKTLSSQGSLLISWRGKISEQEAVIEFLKKEHEKQMKEIANNVLLVQAELRKEQTEIVQVLEEKDHVIAAQEQQIHALLCLNRKLAAAVEQNPPHERRRRNRDGEEICSRRHSSKEFGSEPRLVMRRTQSEADCSNYNSSINQNGHYSSQDVNSSCVNDNYSLDEEQIAIRSPWDKSSSRHVPTLEALDEVAEEMLNDANGSSSSSSGCNDNDNLNVNDKGGRLCNNNLKFETIQAASFNRVMSTHRNVTKPKDVKYKKINRVKSRSLEELRGKLRNWTHPFFVSEKST